MSDDEITEMFEYRAAWLEYVDGRDRQDAEREARRRLIEDHDVAPERVTRHTGG